MRPSKIESFSQTLALAGLEYRRDPFKLRGGNKSHWYFDGRQALSSGAVLAEAGSLIIAKAEAAKIKFEVVAGMGVGGRALASAVSVKKGVLLVHANEDKEDQDPLNGYGLHGAEVATKKTLAVDDVGTTGDSLETLITMIRQENGEVEGAVTLVDRGRGKVAARLGKLGVRYLSLFELNEDTGVIRPI